MKRLWRLLPIVLLVTLGAGDGLGQSYPNKPVRIVVNMAAGGGADLAARMIAQKLSEAWKQPVLIETRGGSGGIVGANAVAKAEPNGYTFLMASSGIAASPSIYRKLPFDPLKDFVPVSQVYSSFLILVVNANVPATSVRELIALAKSQPGRLNYASTGTGGNPHLAAELFKSMTATDIVHIPYKGSAQMNTALVAGEVHVAFMSLESVLLHIKAGKLRALAIVSRARLPPLATVPTMAEAGVVEDLELPNWLGLFAPAGTPRAIVELIQRETVKALNMLDVRDRFIAMGREPVGSTPGEFDAKYKADIAQFARVLNEVRIPLQD